LSIPRTGSAGNVQLSFPTQSGVSYRVRVRDDLTAGSWSLRTNVQGDGAVKSVTDPAGQSERFYELVTRFYPQLEAVYEERFQERYGFWRPILGTVVRKFLECGDLKQGFVRVRCPQCREEFSVALFLPSSMFLPLLP
jgi:hypothetical protein